MEFLSQDKEDVVVNKTKYLGLIMSLMFLARFTRAHISISVTFLQPSHKAMNYVANTETRHPVFISQTKVDLTVFTVTDASHMLYLDAKGHGGIIITHGEIVVATKSFKMKLITKPSAELELVAVEESIQYVLWM